MPTFAHQTPAEVAARSAREVSWRPRLAWPESILVRLYPGSDRETPFRLAHTGYRGDGTPAASYVENSPDMPYDPAELWLCEGVAYAAALPEPASDSDIPL